MKAQKGITVAAILTALGAWGGTDAFANVELGLFSASGTSPNDSASVAASANFVDLGGGQLQITLNNTYSGDTTQVGDVLYGVYFSGAKLTSFVSGDAAANATIWTYGSKGSVTSTTSSSPTPLTDPWGLDGSGSVYGLTGSDKEGLVSVGFTHGNTDGLANSQHQPYDQSSAIFVVDYSGSISAISQVEFLYGTTGPTLSPSGTIITPTGLISGNLVVAPEPTTWAGFTIAGMAVLLGADTRRKQRENKILA